MANSPSGMSENGAREFHRLFMTSFLIFTVIAVIAHVLVWMWRPWFPGPDGYSSVIDGQQTVATSVYSRTT